MRAKRRLRPRDALAGTVALAAMLGAAADALAQPDGASVFARNCAACHQATGKGVPGAFPALAGDPFVRGEPSPVILTLLKGRGGMPRFGSELADADIAAAITYIRGSWGNGAAAVSPAQVAALRSGPAPAAPASAMQAH